jgi:hypothetical protein
MAAKLEKKDTVTKSVLDMPLRAFCGFTGGFIPTMSIEGLAEICNSQKADSESIGKG